MHICNGWPHARQTKIFILLADDDDWRFRSRHDEKAFTSLRNLNIAKDEHFCPTGWKADRMSQHPLLPSHNSTRY